MQLTLGNPSLQKATDPVLILKMLSTLFFFCLSYILSNQFRLRGLPETWNSCGELHGAILKASPRQLQWLRRMLQMLFCCEMICGL